MVPTHDAPDKPTADGEPLAAVATVEAGRAASTQFVGPAQDLAVPAALSREVALPSQACPVRRVKAGRNRTKREEGTVLGV